MKKIKILMFFPLGCMFIPMVCNFIDMRRGVFRIFHFFIFLANVLFFIGCCWLNGYILSSLNFYYKEINIILILLSSYVMCFHTNYEYE